MSYASFLVYHYYILMQYILHNKKHMFIIKIHRCIYTIYI